MTRHSTDQNFWKNTQEEIFFIAASPGYQYPRDTDRYRYGPRYRDETYFASDDG